MRNNKGFTLIELMVSLAIFGILSAAVMTFIFHSSNFYSSVTTTVNLQAQSQMAMTQVREYLLDCNGSIRFDDGSDTLSIYSSTVSIDETDKTLTQTDVCDIFRYDSEDGRLYYSRLTDGAASQEEPVAGDMTAFDYSRDENAVTVSMSFEKRGKTYTGTEVISLRNSPGTGRGAS